MNHLEKFIIEQAKYFTNKLVNEVHLKQLDSDPVEAQEFINKLKLGHHGTYETVEFIDGKMVNK